jgi:Sensors of blue-light using FAD
MNTENVFSIVYASRAGAEFTSRDVRHKLKFFAQSQNSKYGISGMLVYCEGIFVQLIEGTELAVTSLYERIRCDPRHSDVDLLARTVSANRVYGKWTMGFVDGDDELIAHTLLETRFEAIAALRLRAQRENVQTVEFIEAFLDPEKLNLRSPIV